MGADLIFCIIDWPSTADGAPITPGPVLAAEINRRVDALADDGLADLDYYFECLSYEDEYDGEPLSMEQCRAALAKLVTKWFGDESPISLYEQRGTPYLSTDYRGMAAVKLRGFWYIIDGGTSWGDNPTDEFDETNALAGLSSVLQEPFDLGLDTPHPII